MDNPDDINSDFGQIHRFAVRLHEGTLSTNERQELESLLLANPAARRAYLEYVQETACLRWLCVDESLALVEPVAPPVSGARSGLRRVAAIVVVGGLLASICAFVIGPRFFSRASRVLENHETTSIEASAVPQTPAEEGNRPTVATLTSVDSPQWNSPPTGTKVLSRWAVGDRLRLGGGSAELTFDAGAQVKVFGPAEFQITSPTSIRCILGRITTLVDHRGRGFSIETPRAKVVDLGTQFGMTISEQGATEVVVFQGAVDLTPNRHSSAGDTPSRRMHQGEALLVTNSGELERVVAVERNSFLGGGKIVGAKPTEPVIANVVDNVRNPQSAMSYQIVHSGLTNDAPAFVDRAHEWNGLDETGLPPFLEGADYIMPFNDDKFVRSLELKVTLSRPATLYLFVDNNMTVPDWMRDEFTDTGIDIGLDCSKTKWHSSHSLGVGSGRSIDFQFSVWKRDIENARVVTLGSVEPPKDHSLGFNMYGIAAVAN